MLLSAKITKPLCGAGFIDRPRLYAQLDHLYDHRGIFIQAPTGYGKSALISRWLEIVGLDENAAWLFTSRPNTVDFV
jgi:ATP/maltotriose-dependent transcriptional regulator MalT